jgi:hypothetical protein
MHGTQHTGTACVHVQLTAVAACDQRTGTRPGWVGPWLERGGAPAAGTPLLSFPPAGEPRSRPKTGWGARLQGIPPLHTRQQARSLRAPGPATPPASGVMPPACEQAASSPTITMPWCLVHCLLDAWRRQGSMPAAAMCMPALRDGATNGCRSPGWRYSHRPAPAAACLVDSVFGIPTHRLAVPGPQESPAARQHCWHGRAPPSAVPAASAAPAARHLRPHPVPQHLPPGPHPLAARSCAGVLPCRLPAG